MREHDDVTSTARNVKSRNQMRESIRVGWNYRSISVVDVPGVISHSVDFQRSLVNVTDRNFKRYLS